jgi:hypothetical protein
LKLIDSCSLICLYCAPNLSPLFFLAGIEKDARAGRIAQSPSVSVSVKSSGRSFRLELPHNYGFTGYGVFASEQEKL